MAYRVVITGIGPVTSAGTGKEVFFNNLWVQRPNVRPSPNRFSCSYLFRSQWYLPLPEVSLPERGIALAHERIMQAEDRMVILGAKLAFEDAGFTIVSRKGGMSIKNLVGGSAIIGTGLGGMQTAFDSYLCHCLPREVLQAVFPEQGPSYSRMVVPKTMPNSPAAWLSICYGLPGPCSSVNASCASGTYAIGEAFRRIKDGYDQVVLTGGVESLQDRHGFNMRGFDVLGVLTQSADGWPRPFGRKRSGFLFAEGGACLLILEELGHALGRRAPIYAEIADYQSNSDAYSIVQLDPDGKQIIRLLRDLSRGLRIDYLNAHGTGTVANDEIEARAIQAVFGDRDAQPWINSTKGILGHTLGASGAIEAAVTALSVARGTVHGNLTDEPMDNLNLPLAAASVPIENALSVSYGFGGHNGGLLFRRYAHDG